MPFSITLLVLRRSHLHILFSQHVEWRVSIYARNVNEWDKLAKWVVNNKLFSHVSFQLLRLSLGRPSG